MGRKVQYSDAEKVAAGRFDSRFSEESRAKRGLDKIHAFPTLREIPKSSVPLGEAGQKAYDDWARIMFDAGHLTKIMQQWIESYALAQDTISRLAAEGKPIPASVMGQRNRALGEIQLADVDPSLTSKPKAENKFAWNLHTARRATAGDRRKR